MARTTTNNNTATLITSPDLIDVSVTAWMFTDEDLSSDSPCTSSAFSNFSFSGALSHPTSCEYSPAVSPISTTSPSPTRAKKLFQNIVKSPMIDVDGRRERVIDWQSYYNSLTPTTTDMYVSPSLTPTPSTATTKFGSPNDLVMDKPRLSVVIPNPNDTSVTEKTFARKRKAPPKPLTLWDISNARGNSKGKKAATSLPTSPFILVKPVEGKQLEKIAVETPCDILSAVEFDLHATLQSVTQSIPISVRKVQEYEDQWKYYREDSSLSSADDADEDEDEFWYDDDEDCLSDPGTSYPESALYTPFYRSPVVKKVQPVIQRGKQNPFPVRSMRLTTTTNDSSDEPSSEAHIDAAQPKPTTTMASRLEILRKRYHDIKIATPVEQEAMKSALMSPAL